MRCFSSMNSNRLPGSKILYCIRSIALAHTDAGPSCIISSILSHGAVSIHRIQRYQLLGSICLLFLSIRLCSHARGLVFLPHRSRVSPYSCFSFNFSLFLNASIEALIRKSLIHIAPNATCTSYSRALSVVLKFSS